MSKKKKLTAQELVNQCVEDIKRELAHWIDMFHNGCSDPSYYDGINLNLTRNHILYAQRKIEEALGDNFMAYPNEYFYPVPDKLDNNFNAVRRKAPCVYESVDGMIDANRMGLNELHQVLHFDWSEAFECSIYTGAN